MAQIVLLSSILNQIGPCLSSRLAAELVELEKVKPAAARKRIERAKQTADIFAVPGIRFQHNEQFLYTKAHEHSGLLQTSLFKALMSSQSAYRLPLLGIQSRGGMVPQNIFSTVSGFPLTARDSRLDSNAALSYLLKAELVHRDEETGLVTLSSVFAPNVVSINRHHSRLIAEDLLLTALKDWLSLQGFLSTNKFSSRARNELAQFGFYQWDLVAPSFISPLSAYGKEGTTPGFIVADVILGRNLSVPDVTPFVHKVAAIRSNPNNRNFMAILMADWFEKDALLYGRKQGLLFTTPKNLFGKPFSALLDDLIQAFEHKQKFFAAEPDYLHKLVSNMQAISHLEDAVKAAHRALFVLLLGYCYSEIRHSFANYDAYIEGTEGVELLVEAKGGSVTCDIVWHSDKKPVKSEELANWISKLPSLFTALQRRKAFPAQAFICTNRTFEPHAIQLLEKTAKHYDIGWIDGRGVRAMIAALDIDLSEKITASMMDTDSPIEPPQPTNPLW